MELLGILFFWLPPVLAETCGSYGWIAILIGIAAAGLLSLLLEKRKNRERARKGICFYNAARILVAGWAVWEAASVAKRFLLPEQELLLLVVLSMLPMAFGIWGRREGIREASVLLTVATLSVFLVVLAANVAGIQPALLLKRQGEAGFIALGAVLVFIGTLPGITTNRPHHILALGALMLAEYLILMGTLGAALTRQLPGAIVVLAGAGKGIGGGSVRLEAFMAGCGYLWFVMLAAELAGRIAVTEKCRAFGRKTAVLVGIFCVSLLCFSGCGKEIEDKSFVNTVIVTPEKVYLVSPDLSKATGEEKAQSGNNVLEVPLEEWRGIEQVVGNQTTREVEISHLEVMIVQEELLKQEDFYVKLVESVKRDTAISWNTAVLKTSMENPIELNDLEAVEGNLGGYIKSLLEDGTKWVSLLELLNSRENYHSGVTLPEILVKDDRPLIDE